MLRSKGQWARQAASRGVHVSGGCCTLGPRAWPACVQVTWEVVQHGAYLGTSASGAAPETGVYVGIQQMEYGGLAAPHLLSIGPFSGQP